MLSPYVIASYSVYWKFPTQTERESLVPSRNEIGRIAWQESDNSFWVLLSASPAWKELGSGASSGFTYKILGSVTVPENYQHIVYNEVEVAGDAVIEGELVII